MTATRFKTCVGIALIIIAGTSILFAQDDTATTSRTVPRETRAEAHAIATSVNTAMTDPVLQGRNPRYILRPGDVVEIQFLLAPSFNQVQAVQPDGYIALQNLGELHVAGKTVPALIEALKDKYSKVMKDPVITVVLKDFEHPYFIANGQVVKPGKYELRGITTVTQAIAIAGGLNDVAKSSNVLLFRRVSDDYVNIKQLDLKKMLSKGNLYEDVELRPGDLLFVPKSVSASILKSLFPHTSTGLYFPVRSY